MYVSIRMCNFACYTIDAFLCLFTVPKSSPHDSIPIDPDSLKNNRDYENMQPSAVDMTPNPAYTIP